MSEFFKVEYFFPEGVIKNPFLYLIDINIKDPCIRPISQAINRIYAFILWFNYIFKWFTFNIVFTFISIHNLS